MSSKQRKQFSQYEQRNSYIGKELPTERPIEGDYEEEILVSEIEPSPHQTRKTNIDEPGIVELAGSIERLGLINNIVVRPNKDKSSIYKWVLITGERRLLAHKRAGKEKIKATIRNDLKDKDLDAALITLAENVSRKQLTPNEACEAIQMFREKFNLTNKEIAEIMGYEDEERVSQLAGILTMPSDLIKELDSSGKLTKRHIDAFKMLIKPFKIKSMEIQDNDNEIEKKVKGQINNLLEKVIKEDLTGEEAIAYAKDIIRPNKIKSFLTTYNMKLPYLIKKRPAKMSEEKRKVIIHQAQNMIKHLEQLIKEENETLLRISNNKQ